MDEVVWDRFAGRRRDGGDIWHSSSSVRYKEGVTVAEYKVRGEEERWLTLELQSGVMFLRLSSTARVKRLRAWLSPYLPCPLLDGSCERISVLDKTIATIGI